MRDDWTDAERKIAEAAVYASRREKRIEAAKILNLEVFAVTRNADLTEGRGPLIDFALFADPADAAVAHELIQGPQGGANDGIPVARRLFVSVDSFLDSLGAGATSSYLNAGRVAKWMGADRG